MVPALEAFLCFVLLSMMLLTLAPFFLVFAPVPIWSRSFEARAEVKSTKTADLVVQSVRIPLTPTKNDPDGREVVYTVKAVIAPDTQPATLVFDTGSNGIVLLSDLLSAKRQLELRNQKTHHIHHCPINATSHPPEYKGYPKVDINYTGGQGSGNILLVNGGSMEIGGVRSSGATVGCYYQLKIPLPPGIDGVLGMGQQQSPSDAWYYDAVKNGKLSEGFSVDLVKWDGFSKATSNPSSATLGGCLCSKPKWYKNVKDIVGGQLLGGSRGEYVINLDTGDPHLQLFRDDIEQYISQNKLTDLKRSENVDGSGSWHVPAKRLTRLPPFKLVYHGVHGDSFERDIAGDLLKMGCVRSGASDRRCWTALVDIGYRNATNKPVLVYGTPFFQSAIACFHPENGFAWCDKKAL